MSEHTGLIERLRNYRGGYDHEHDCHGAANVIEQLEAALLASTELLRTMHVTGGVTVAGIKNQIAANEAVLGDNNGTDQK